MKTKAENPSSFLPVTVSLLILIFTLIAGIQLPVIRDAYRDSDFFSYWLAGRDIAFGVNPYESSQWISDHDKYGATWISDPKFIYPLPLGILFVPLGLLPLEYASSIWIFLTIVSIFFSLYFVANKFDITSYLTIFNPNILGILIGLFFFRPFITVLYWGQLGGFILLVITTVTYFFRQDKWFWGGVLLPVLCYKPQIGFPVVGLIFLWLFVKRKWSAFVGSIITISITLIISYGIHPNWVLEWLSVGGDKVLSTAGRSVTIWGLSAILCNFNGLCIITSSTIFSLICLIGSAYILNAWKNESPEYVIGFVICIGLLITPYLLVNDLLLLLFPLTIMISKSSPKMVIGLFFITSLIFFLVVPLNTTFDSEGLNGIVTLIILFSYLKTLSARSMLTENRFRVFHGK